MIKQTFHKIEFTKEEEQKLRVDDLLWQRYCYTKNYMPNNGHRRISPNFRDAVISKGLDEVDISDVDPNEGGLLTTVEFCLFQLPSSHISAVEREMMNRASGAQVWRFPINVTYPEALDAALIIFRKERLV